MNYRVCIIIVNYNQYQYTLDCINSVLRSNYDNVKILIVDNSINKTIENAIKELNSKKIVLLLPKENLGYVGGVNLGLKEGLIFNPDYFLIMNNDTIIDKESIINLVNCCKNYKNKAIVTGKVYHYYEKEKFQEVGSIFKNRRLLKFRKIGINEFDKGQYDSISERDMIDDVFWLFHKKLITEIGFYSNYFWFNSEQADFAMRAKTQGYKLIFTPYAKIWHKGSPSIGGLYNNPKQAYWTTQSSLIFRYLHLGKGYFALYYFLTLYSIFRTYIKAIIYKLLNINNLFLYAKSKYKALIYFNKWLIKRNINTGENPFIVK